MNQKLIMLNVLVIAFFTLGAEKKSAVEARTVAAEQSKKTFKGIKFTNGLFSNDVVVRATYNKLTEEQAQSPTAGNEWNQEGRVSGTNVTVKPHAKTIFPGPGTGYQIPYNLPIRVTWKVNGKEKFIEIRKTVPEKLPLRENEQYPLPAEASIDSDDLIPLSLGLGEDGETFVTWG